ncbi:unnamed protein product [Prorocentrum cordatum]|uniref:Uncharacterized protein n=1 Tax=Prorocentrum cordatum TaxID=2364126 RepID=A0ABN9WVQ6_9DINO|nr:unnamed protein product [Polarella glacialis]
MCSGGRRCMGLVGGASATPARRKSGTTLSRTGGTSAMRRHPPTPRAGTPPGRPERSSGGDVGPLRRRGPTADCRGRRGATTHGAAAGAAARSPGGGGGRRGAREGRRRLRAASARGGGRQLSARPSRRRGLCEAGEAGSPGRCAESHAAALSARGLSAQRRPAYPQGKQPRGPGTRGRGCGVCLPRSLSPSAHAIRPSARRPCRSAGGSASAGPTRSAASWPRCPC